MTDRELDDPERDAEQNAWGMLLMFCASPRLQDYFFLGEKELNEQMLDLCQ